MWIRTIALASAALVVLAACTDSTPVEPEGGAIRDVPPENGTPLYSPESRDALALGLPDQVGGKPLHSSAPEVIAQEEHDYANDTRVKAVLVAGGYSPSRVVIEHKSAEAQEGDFGELIPPVALAAVQVKGISAEEFAEWDPTFYLLLTSVEVGDHFWQGEKPERSVATVRNHEVWLADFRRFQVAWYAYGDVLYVIVAENDQYLHGAVDRLPQAV
jgi:hypothetical protein